MTNSQFLIIVGLLLWAIADAGSASPIHKEDAKDFHDGFTWLGTSLQIAAIILWFV